MTRPVRLQLSRKKGFDLQALSMATNGLPAVNVARPSMWGNPYHVGQIAEPAARRDEIVYTPVSPHMTALSVKGSSTPGIPLLPFPAPLTAADVVSRYRAHLADRGLIGSVRLTIPLAGKNLACWCKIHQHGIAVPCHADVLLSIANDIPMDEVISENIRRATGEEA